MLKPLSISALVLIIDQATKQIIQNFMELGQSDKLLGDLLRLTYIENDGLAFSIKVSNLGIFTGISALASGIVLYYIHKYKNEGFTYTLPLSLILGGAIGNLIDRIRFGRVVDFIDVGISSYRWPVFNAADSAITIGLILFIFISFRHQEEQPELEKPVQAQDG